METLSERFSLAGRTALITGSNRGIGRGIAFALAEFGADVVIHCSRDVSRAEEVADEITKTAGGNTFAIAVDLSAEDAADQLYNRASNLVQQVDILILNASVQVRKTWTDITDEDYKFQMDVNLRSSIQTIQQFLPDMVTNQWGTHTHDWKCATG